MRETTVLIIEDDESIRQGLIDALAFAGYTTHAFHSGPEGLAAAIELPIDLVLLDVMLPGMDGFTILRKLREARPVLPVIMLTARGSESDRVEGLDSGADDYVVKPFSARELLARVEAILRRSPGRSTDVKALSLNGVRADLARGELVCLSGETVAIGDRDAGILRCLAVNRDRTVSRDELLQAVWGVDPQRVTTRTVDMQIARLREKIVRSGADIEWIETVRGRGYRISDMIECDGTATG